MDEHEIDVEGLEAALATGPPLIDVRQPDEYIQVHVASAQLVPMDELPEHVDEIPTDATVYLICATGNRSHRATQWLLAQGIAAVNVVGGTRAWMDAGKPTVSGPDPG